MGYYTRFEWNVEPQPTKAVLQKMMEYPISYNSLGDMGLEPGEKSGDFKWYDHEGDFLQLSIAFPHFTFSLQGVGEENGDQWVKYFNTGKMQVYRATEWVPPQCNLNGEWQ